MRYTILYPFSIFLLIVASNAKIASNPDDKDIAKPKEDKPLDVDIIFRSLGMPYCMRKCVDEFINSTTTLWTMQGVVPQARTVCSSHAKAISCLNDDKFCDMNKVFKVATSSIEYMCAKKYVLFERMEKCLEKVVDPIMSQCDKECYARSNLTAFSEDSNVKFAATVGGNFLIVTEHLGELCGSLQCTLPCVTKKLNEACALSGWLTLDMLLQPLDAAAVLIDKLSPPLKDLVVRKLDKRCRFAINTSQLNRIRNGDFTAFNAK